MTDIKLGDFCDQSRKITYGIVQPGKESAEGVPIVRVNNFKGHSLDLSEQLRVAPNVEASYQRSRPKPGDLLISLVGSIGQVVVAPPDIQGWNLARAVGLVPFDDIQKAHWAAYAIQLQENQDFIQQRANTTVQATFNLKDLAQIPIPQPGDEIEARALRALRMLDDTIELNRRMNETLEEMARALFRDWFIDFGPTRRQMDGATDPAAIMGHAFPDDKAAALAPLFPVRLTEGNLPEGWIKGVLESIANSPRRGIHPADGAENTPCIGLEHMPRRSIALGQWEGAGKVTSNKSVFKKGDLLFGKLRPYFHKVGRAPVDGICSTDIVVISPKSKEWDAFVTSCLSSDGFVEYTNKTSTGTRMPRTSWKIMAQYAICLPPEPIAEAFQGIVEKLLDMIHSNIYETHTLAQIRDLLLPKLMSGQIQLKDAPTVQDTLDG